ncbi:MAG: hypothetical protein K0B16_15230, partial [Burkholderiaceae bacterium]|nr:hypothetical protein [Burkholderiaceae bacterium]
GFWDGKSFVPLDFSIHNEPGKTGKRGFERFLPPDQRPRPPSVIAPFGSRHAADIGLNGAEGLFYKDF